MIVQGMELQELKVVSRRGTETNVKHNIHLIAEDEVKINGEDGFDIRNTNNNSDGVIESIRDVNINSGRHVKVDADDGFQSVSGIMSGHNLSGNSFIDCKMEIQIFQ